MNLRPHLALAASVLALGACADAGAPSDLPSHAVATTGTAAFRTRAGDRLATIESESGRPALYVQHADGSGRVRVHFDHVSDHVPGNYSPQQLPITDETIMKIQRAKWSPDGRYLAVAVSPAYDVTAVVLVSADGHALRVVSPNSQYMSGEVEWSPDGRRIAYAMATTYFGGAPDLFVTDLGTDRVTRVTQGGRLSWYDAYRFDATGRRLLFTARQGWADDGANGLTRLAYAELGTGAIVEGATVVGDPQGLARDGTWALLLRYAGDNLATRQLVRVPVDGAGAETVLASGDFWNATLLEGDREAVVKAPVKETGAMEYHVFGVGAANDDRGALPTGPTTQWAALWRAP